MKVNDVFFLTNNLVSDFIIGTKVKVIGFLEFNNSNKIFVTLDDVNHIPTKERGLKRCTVLLSDIIL